MKDRASSFNQQGHLSYVSTSSNLAMASKLCKTQMNLFYFITEKKCFGNKLISTKELGKCLLDKNRWKENSVFNSRTPFCIIITSISTILTIRVESRYSENYILNKSIFSPSFDFQINLLHLHLKKRKKIQIALIVRIFSKQIFVHLW